MPTLPRLKSNKKLITRNNKRLTPGFKFRVSGFKFARGQILILALAFLTIILILSASLFGKIANYVRFGKVNTDTQQATFLAEAGIDYATFKINTDTTGYGDPCGSASLISLGTGQIEICVTGSSTKKPITSTAYIPTKTAAKKIKRAISASISQTVPLEVNFGYAAVSLEEDITIESNVTVGSPVNPPSSIYSKRNIIGNYPFPLPCTSRVYGDVNVVGTFNPPFYCPTVAGTTNTPPPPYFVTGLAPSVWKGLAQDGNYVVGTCKLSNPFNVDCPIDPINPRITTCPPEPGSCIISGTWGPHLFNGNVSCVNPDSSIGVYGTLYITGWLRLNCTGHRIGLDGSFAVGASTVVLAEQEIWLNSDHQTPVSGYILFYSLATTDEAIVVGDRGIQAAVWPPNGRTKLNDSDVLGSSISGCILGKSVLLTSGTNLIYYSGCPALDFGPTSSQLLSWTIKKGSYQ